LQADDAHMSTSAHSLSLSFGSLPQFAPKPKRPVAPQRRGSSPQQGRALELLGHAIEYLVDSRLYDQWETPADAAAVHLLMGCSRAVFSECEVLQPWHQRALMRRLHLQHQRTAPTR
jgi:hypothetical protein